MLYSDKLSYSYMIQITHLKSTYFATLERARFRFDCSLGNCVIDKFDSLYNNLPYPELLFKIFWDRRNQSYAHKTNRMMLFCSPDLVQQHKCTVLLNLSLFMTDMLREQHFKYNICWYEKDPLKYFAFQIFCIWNTQHFEYFANVRHL